ncbi:hypothetical protein [Chryseobacterium taiwanense]|uniref:Lipoprotein n=1 Tax=Chryseobacterium taiwanense TaxID=363331 RepID=A0A0B4ECC9_9FLAO|nr:hypothetical protein [Chryseobacterium taiwanense]KIC64233.1 hypothetical protein RM51_05845 [Chryseobacterium taiwanense]
MKILSAFLFVSLISCNKFSNQNLYLIDDFKVSRKEFTKDTIDLENVSSEGGELISYFSDKKKFRVFDFFIYGEMGKLNYTYFTDNNLKIKSVIKRDYKYDKPITEENLKIDSTIIYYDYSEKPILLDQNLKEIHSIQQLKKQQIELDSFFKNNLRIHKD